MRRQAAAKGLRVLPGDATALPFGNESHDAVMMVSMLHQVEDWRQALSEARRVLRPGGRLAIMLLTADHLEQVTWAFSLFPSMRTFAAQRRPSIAEILSELSEAHIEPFWFTDLQDASIAALCAHPATMLDERIRRQTSFFERLERDNPAELAAGLAQLRAQLARGDSPLSKRKAAREQLGDACVIAWNKPMPKA
jgi:SAM-dependent methyltransferase